VWLVVELASPSEAVSFFIGMTVGWNKLRAVPAIRTGFDTRMPELRGACSSLRKDRNLSALSGDSFLLFLIRSSRAWWRVSIGSRYPAKLILRSK